MKRRPVSILTALAVAWATSLPAGASSLAGAEEWLEVLKLLPGDGAAGDWFGQAVAADGDTVLVTAQLDDDNGTDSGSAYAFVRTGGAWTEQDKLLASDGAVDDWFGSAASLSGDTALIGAFPDDDNGSASGSAYVFVRAGDAWSEQTKLLPADGSAGDSFGWSVSVSADTAVVGAPDDNDNGADSGSAYVFVRSGDIWTEQAKLLPGDGGVDDRFGWRVSVSGDTAVIGAPRDDDHGSNSGAAYVFVRSGTLWTEQEKLTASDAAAEDFAGIAVSLSGDTTLVGSLFDDDNGADSGSAYVFVRSGSTWTEEAKVSADDGAAGDWFGFAVSLSGDRALVGAYRDDHIGTDAGSAYVFERSQGSWDQRAKLTASDSDFQDALGISVALSGQIAVAGARGDEPNGDASGSAYLFTRALVFEDGFESGDTSAWSATIP